LLPRPVGLGWDKVAGFTAVDNILVSQDIIPKIGILVDRFEAMSILLLTVERGSFTAASKALGMPLPTVSRKVGELEQHLGAKLLTRTTRKLALTDTGTAFVAAAKRIVEDVNEAERQAAGEFSLPRGELILTAPVLFGRLHLLPILRDFLADFPDIDVRLVLSDRNLHFIDDHINMAVRIGALPDSGLVATPIGAMRSVVCASPDFLRTHGTPRHPQELAGMPCVTFEFQSPTPTWPFQPPGGKAPIQAPVRSRLSVSTAEAAVWAAENGIGLTRVFQYQCDAALRRGSLKVVLSDFELEPLPMNLVHAPRRALPLKMRTFLDFATPKLRERIRRD